MAREPQSSSSMKSRRDRDEDGDEERTERKSRRDEEQEDRAERSSKSRRDDDDEDEDRPAKKANGKAARADDDDDEDDRPKSKARARDDDDEDGDDDDKPINLQDADEDSVGVGEVVPRGRYTCRVDEAEFVEFKTGSKGARIRLEVIEGEYAANGKTRKKGKMFFTNIVVSEAAANILKANLKALGVPKSIYNAPFKPSTLRRLCDEGELVGNELVAEVTIRTYEGDKQNQVRKLMLPGQDGGKAEGKGSFFED